LFTLLRIACTKHPRQGVQDLKTVSFFLSELELLGGFSILFFLFCNALFYTVGYFRSNKDWGRYLMNEEYLFFSVD